MQVARTNQYLHQLVQFTRALKRILQSDFPSRSQASCSRTRLYASLRCGYAHPPSDEILIEQHAQALVSALATIESVDTATWSAAAVRWLVECSDPVVRYVLDPCFRCPARDVVPRVRQPASAEPVQRHLHAVRNWLREWHRQQGQPEPFCYEQFLTVLDQTGRKRCGVYFTPRPLAQFLLSRIDAELTASFELAGGLASSATWGDVQRKLPQVVLPPFAHPGEPFVTLLDPAAGDGVFLVHAVEMIRAKHREIWQQQNLTLTDWDEAWNRYVREHLLPRLQGLELLWPAAVVAQLRLAEALARSGYDFSGHAESRLLVADAIGGPVDLADFREDGCRERMRRVEDVRTRSAVTIILGNPPFSGVSSHRGGWIQDLLRGRLAGTPGYYEVDGKPLNERKHWLQDDYVKFFRYAQWRLERTGCGLLGFVTNHGYLDNATFRGMRQQLMRTFPRIHVVDLNGNHKRPVASAGEGRDDSVFSVAQGVAASLFCRPPRAADRAEVHYEELRGTRETKLRRLQEPHYLGASGGSRAVVQPAACFTPSGPFYIFVPRRSAGEDDYRRGQPITEVMPNYWPAPVTARDHFVVAFDERELIERIAEFRDPAWTDAEIRAKYFTRTRSARYAAGDTRGWKLSDARRRLAEDPAWHLHARDCLYRPFDRRRIYYDERMIDWPRPALARQMLGHPNQALIARRQMVPNQPCHYFWATSEIALDGVIRSDNRGTETIFPLYLYDERPAKRTEEPAAETTRQVNFSAEFVARFAEKTGWHWCEAGANSERQGAFGPEDLLHYIYGLFHSPSYRTRYADDLRVDYPRVLLPAGPDMGRSIRDAGRALLSWHTLQRAVPAEPMHLRGNRPEPTIAAGYPRYADGRVYINDSTWFGPVSEPIWAFQVGAHQVCRKWLKDRRGRALGPQDLQHYRYSLDGIHATLRWMREIDAGIEYCGGWDEGFA